MTPSKAKQFHQTTLGKWLFRLGMGVLILLFLLWLAYLAMGKRPAFYKKFEKISVEQRKIHRDHVLEKSLQAYEQIQHSDHWVWQVTEDEINSWFAVDGTKKNFNFLPKEVQEPRVSLHGQTIEIAARIQYGYISGMLHLNCTLSVLEPNVIALRIDSAKLGLYPFDRRQLVHMITRANNDTVKIEESNEGGDPVLLFRPNIVNEKKNEIVIESIEINQGTCQVIGSVIKKHH